MSSLVPPTVSTKAPFDKGKSKRSSKKGAPSHSSRRVKNDTGKDVTHVVRVTVLGLAGITVDRSKCRYSSKDADLPASPSKMRAVVAFSRNSMIRGTTTLSKKLTRSPNEDVVVATTETEQEEVSSVAKNGEVLATEENREEALSVAKSATGDDAASATAKENAEEEAVGEDDEATHETKSSKGSMPPPRRHLAVWASDDGTLGSTVTFEANLHRSDKEGTKSGTAASSAFTPKSFDLTIGLTDGRNSDHAAVALPLGVATLAVSGEESTKEKAVTVDLPVWTLSQARPLDAADGGGYPLITIAPASEATADGVTSLKKKRTGLQRLFSKKDKHGNIAFPSSAERDAFSCAYSMDSTGDAILRVSMEVSEKTSAAGISKGTGATVHKDQKSRRKVSKRPGSPVPSQSDSSFDVDTDNSDDETEWTEETDYTGSIVTAEDETITLDDSLVTNEENSIVFFSWVNRPGRLRGDDRRQRGRRSVRRSTTFPCVDKSNGNTSIKVLGRQVPLPSCTRSDSYDSREDMTHVTADFFSDSYQIPLCRGIAKKEDDDSTTMFTDQNSAASTRIVDIMNEVLCQSEEPKKEGLKIVSTFSTLTENPRRNEVSTPKQVFVMNEGKNNSVGGSFFSDEAKVPMIPDEPSEVDDIIRIVRSRQPRNSLNPHVELKSKEDKASSEEQKNSATDVSPKGVEEFIGMEADDETNPRSRVLQTISDVLQCHYPTGHGQGPRYEPFEPQIPPVIIQSEADTVSVGELTATTHERNIEGASDARLLERARQMLNEGKTAKNEETEPHKLMSIPIPFCGRDGICSSLVRRDTTSCPIRLDKEESNSFLEGKKSQKVSDEEAAEDVAKEVVSDERILKAVPEEDERTICSPIEVVKVASEERSTSFSRVRSPSADRHAKEKAIRSLYSESLPIYASMNGDESESVVGAFVESKSDDRQLFNPITGQEVDQAFI